MRALLIGLGRWGEQHLRVLRGLAADIWVADVSSDRLAWAVQQGVDAAHAVADYRVALGHVGAVRYATGRFAGFKRPRMDVGVTQTDGIHYFDLFAYLLGRDATAATAIVRDYLGRGMDDLSFTAVEYGPTPVVVEAGYFVPGTHRECVIVGERG